MQQGYGGGYVADCRSPSLAAVWSQAVEFVFWRLEGIWLQSL
jgi:hypothetical protein